MEEKTYSVKLADGTTLENLKQNGSYFISASQVDPAIFEGNCSPVVISDGTVEETHENMTVDFVTQRGDEYWFPIRDLSPDELEKIKIRSDLEYLAMMAEVSL